MITPASGWLWHVSLCQAPPGLIIISWSNRKRGAHCAEVSCCGILWVRTVSFQSWGLCTHIIPSFTFKLSTVYLKCLWRLQLCLGERRKMAFQEGVFQVIKGSCQICCKQRCSCITSLGWIVMEKKNPKVFTVDSQNLLPSPGYTVGLPGSLSVTLHSCWCVRYSRESWRKYHNPSFRWSVLWCLYTQINKQGDRICVFHGVTARKEALKKGLILLICNHAAN